MGKTNKGQRTKGNTRPSSSSHSAHLLDVTGKSLCGFIGFDVLEKDIPSYIPVTGQHSAEVDLSVDSNLRMIMRKMLKKDCVTRLKAVQEFGDACSEKEKEVLTSVLLFWPRLFNKLALDNDRRIREAAHQANGKLISKVKREVAPYLKNIMATWLLGQCDSYAPAASSAQSSFIDTFPEQKQSDALLYCKAEIFSVFKDNLLEQTPKSLSETCNLTDVEDIESRYVLVISSTLQAMKLFLSIVSTDHYQTVHQDYLDIIAENKFWKFSKHKNAQIRGSWYTLVSSLIRIKGDLFSNMEKKLVASVFGSLAEDNPLVSHSVWEAALYIVSNIENCWQGISIHKVVFPQLWSLLNEGGNGSAHCVYPCILPFLSKLPAEVLHDENFQLQFFTCLKQGLLCEKIKSSPMEYDAVIVTFFECLQYISFNVSENTFSKTLLMKVIDEILPVLKISFYDSKYSYLTTSKFYPLTGKFIQNLEIRCLQSNESQVQSLHDILSHFWNSFNSLVLKYVDKKPEDKAKISLYITYFFHSIFVPTEFSVSFKVRFKDESTECDEIPVHQEVKPLEVYENMPITFSYIINLVISLSDIISKNSDVRSLKIFDEILASTLSSKLFLNILKRLPSVTKDNDNTPMDFFNYVILKWVELFSNDMHGIMYIVDILFTVCSVVQESEAVEMLNSCCKLNNPLFLEKIIQKVAEVYSYEPVIQVWIKDHMVIESLIGGVEKITDIVKDTYAADKKDILAYKSALSLCLNCSNMQAYFKQDNIKKILLLCCDCICKYKDKENAEFFVETSCDLIESVLKNDMVYWAEKDIHEILSFCFNECLCFDEPLLSDQNSSMMLKLWKTGVFAFIKTGIDINSDNFIWKAATDLNFAINNLKNVDSFPGILNRCTFLLESVQEADLKTVSSIASVLCKFLLMILPTENQWNEIKQNLRISLMSSFLQKKLFYVKEEKCTSIDKKCIDSLIVKAEIASRILCDEIAKDSIILTDFGFEKILVSQMPHLTWTLSYVTSNGYMHEGFDFRHLDVHILKENLSKIVMYLSSEKVQIVLHDLYKYCLNGDIGWILALQLFTEIIENARENFADHFLPILIDCVEKERENFIFLQLFGQFLPVQKKQLLVKELLENPCLQTKLFCPESLQTFAKICSLLQDSEVLKDEEILLLLSRLLETFSDALLKSKDEFCLELIYMISVIARHLEDKATLALMYNIFTVFLRDTSITVTNPRSMLVLFQICSIYLSLQAVENKTFLQEISMAFLEFFIKVKRSLKRFDPLSQVFDLVMDALLEAISLLPLDVLNRYTNNSYGSEYCLGNFTSILMSDIPQVQLISHILLMKLMPYVSKITFEKENTPNDNDEETIPSTLVPLIDTLKSVNELVDQMLAGLKIGDCCAVLPYTDSYMLASAFLYTSLELLQFFSSSPSQVRSGYVALLEEEKILSKLYSSIYPLMPESPFQLCRRNSNCENENRESLTALFFHSPDISTGNPSPENIQKMACYTFCTAMRVIPASVRTWWNNLDKKSADIINKFTTKYISNIICIEEIRSVYENENLFQNMVVKARLGSREVVATYTVDDFTIELHLQLPCNYPLGPVTAEKRGKIVLAQQEWRHWLMQLTTVLNYQNGSVLDSLNIWKKNLEKKFEGVEECMICYYILHNSNMKLPNLSCHVCRKKFHSACLYKWFKTSNNFTCPLCRNEFTGLH